MKQDRIAIVACVKHEELYIKEWLDYHIKCGIDHFFLCDNNEPDYAHRLEDLVKEYGRKVEVLDYTSYEYVQPYCYDNLWNDARMNEFDWMLVIDIDEFICIPKHNDNIKEYLATIPKNVMGVSFNWRYYGDNGLVHYDDRPVTERFPEPVNAKGICNGQSLMIKTMIRTKRYFKRPLSLTSQHTLSNEIQRYDARFNRIHGKSRMQAPDDYDPDTLHPYIQKLYDTFYIKHYYTKTIEEFVKFKINKTISVKIPDRNPKSVYTVHGFFQFNERTDEKTKLAKELIEELGQDAK